MKLNLLESGIQNINQIAKQYNKAKIYFHIDLDGISSAISMKYYLQQYGIKTVAVQKIQYGDMEYSVAKPEEGVLPVLVDFAHGKTFMKIHTDHHENQIKYNSSSNQFRHSKSNADTISSIISIPDIFPKDDIRIINMIDSAGFKDENVNPWDMLRATFSYNDNESSDRNHLKMGMACGKLLLSYKNKPNFLESVVMESKPSLLSMFRTMMNIIKGHIDNGDKGWVSPQQIDINSKDYYDRQSSKSIPQGTVEHIKDMTNGESTLIGNTIFQVGGGQMTKAGSFDRYTAFRLYPKAKYFIMLWDSIGMMQVSVNPWYEEKLNVNLGDIILRGIFEEKYVPLLSKPKYDISLLTIKKSFEKGINDTNEESASGFDMNELKQLFEKDFSELSEKQLYRVNQFMNWKPSNFIKNGDDKHDKEVDLALSLLSKFKIPLVEIIRKSSGGHPAITNLSGFGFIDDEYRNSYKVSKGLNPYDKPIKSDTPKPTVKPTEQKEKKDTTSTKILKSIAQDVVKILNK